MKKIIIAVAVLVLGSSVAFAAISSYSSPTCTLTYNGAPIQMLRPANINVAWTSTSGTLLRTLKVDAFTQPNIYTATVAQNGSVTVPVTASLGLAATLTVQNSNGSLAVCKVAIPMFFTPVR